MDIGCRRLRDDCDNVLDTKFRCKDCTTFAIHGGFKCDFKVSIVPQGMCAFRRDDPEYGYVCDKPEAHAELRLLEKLESI